MLPLLGEVSRRAEECSVRLSTLQSASLTAPLKGSLLLFIICYPILSSNMLYCDKRSDCNATENVR